MDYGDAKVKTMAESLLPSRRRKGAREDKRLAHRRHRRQVAERLGQLRWCDYDDFIPSVIHNNNCRIHEIKWERRAADNVSAVERWAEALTKDVPKGDRVAFMKRLLPDNLIGRHALTHLDFLDADFDYRRWRAEFQESRRCQVAELTYIVKGLLHFGAHAEINIAIKRAHRAGHNRSRYDRSADERIECVEQKDCCGAPVLLAGSHDVDNFVGRLIYTEHREWADAVRKLSEQLGGKLQ
jgi:hypothetical protein